jgi:hypothetical protein
MLLEEETNTRVTRMVVAEVITADLGVAVAAMVAGRTANAHQRCRGPVCSWCDSPLHENGI